MAQPDFIHLRVHSAYSLSEGAVTIKQMAALAAKNAMPAVAITDTGNLFGALEFSDALVEKAIQPIIGLAIKVDLAEAPSTSPKPQGSNIRHLPSLVLLAQTEQGYANLMRLTSRSFLDVGPQDEAHVTWALFEQCADGVICLSGGPSGPLNEAIVQGQAHLAETTAARLKKLFGDRFYIELQRHGLDTERAAEQPLIDIAYEQGIPLVATNEVYFAAPEDFAAHDALICIAEGEVIATDDRRRLTPEHYFKSQREMVSLFADLPEAIENTVEIARRCAYRVKGRKPILPRFADDEENMLREEAKAGLAARIAATGLAAGMTQADYEQRLEFELSVILKMKYAGYFLIVSDFIRWAKAQSIPVGPGRGSGAGSLVAYSLNITDLDPLRFNLLFERFLNPDRVSMPDFDVDFCQDRRDEVISYVQSRYGKENVAQIITFGKLQARMVTRDVGRVLQLPYGQVDRLSKMIPANPANPVSLSQAIEGEPRLQHERDSDPTVKTLFEMALKLEGLYRNASTHAAGIVIGDRPLDQLVPLYRDPRSGLPATQFNMKYVEKAGLVKFDFLGLKTLTVIDKAQKLIRVRVPDFDASKIPLDDPATFKMLAQGDTDEDGLLEAREVLKLDLHAELVTLSACETARGKIAQSVESLSRTNARILGTVLNRLVRSARGYYYYSEYSTYYADDAKTAIQEEANQSPAQKKKSSTSQRNRNFLDEEFVVPPKVNGVYQIQQEKPGTAPQ